MKDLLYTLLAVLGMTLIATASERLDNKLGWFGILLLAVAGILMGW